MLVIQLTADELDIQAFGQQPHLAGSMREMVGVGIKVGMPFVELVPLRGCRPQASVVRRRVRAARCLESLPGGIPETPILHQARV